MAAIVVSACSSGGASPSAAASAAAPSSAASAAASTAPSEAASEAASAGAGGRDPRHLGGRQASRRDQALAQAWATENGVDVQAQAITENLTTQFKTASQQGTGPDIVVWAHDVIGDFVQNGAIDPVQMPDTSGFDPLAVKGMTFNGQLYGVPYSVENIALIRNTDWQPNCPTSMEDLVKTGQQLVKDKKALAIMALQVGQKGDAYHIYPLFTSGGGSYFGTTATGDPDPTNVTVDSAESIAASQKLYDLGEKGVGALKRSIDDKNAIPLFTGGKTPFLRLRPVGDRGHRESRHQLRHLRRPGVRGWQARLAVHRRQRLLPCEQGRNEPCAQEFLTSVVPTPEFQQGLYAVDPRRPALTAAVDALDRSPVFVSHYSIISRLRVRDRRPGTARRTSA